MVSAAPHGPLFTESANSCVPVGELSSRRDPDHRRDPALGHQVEVACRRPSRRMDVAAKAMRLIDRRPGLAGLGVIVRRQRDPAPHVNRPAPERRQLRADEIDWQQLGKISGEGLLARIMRGVRIVCRHDRRQGDRLNRPGKGHVDDLRNDVTGAAAGVIVVAVDIEDGLQVIAPRRQLRPCAGHCVGVGIDRRNLPLRK